MSGFVSKWRRAAWLVLTCLVLAMFARPAGAGEFRFILEGEAGFVDDGNYAQVDQDQVLRGEQLGRVGANLRLSYEMERLNLALGYSPFYERSIDGGDGGDEGEVSGTYHRLDLGLVGDLTRRLTLGVRERLQKSPNLDLYAPAVTPDTVAVSRRGDQLAHSLDVTVNHAVTRRAGLLLGATHTLRTFEEDDLFDSESLGARIGAAFNLMNDRTIDATAGLARFEYENDGEADVGSLGVAYGRELGRDGRLRVEAGAWSVESTERVRLVPVEPEPEPEPGVEPEPEIPTGFQTFEETGWRGGLQYSYGRERVRWALGYSHDVAPGTGLGRTVEADNLFAGVSTSIGRRWTLGLDASASRQSDLRDNADLDLDTGSNGSNDSNTEFAAGTARFGWTLAQAVRLTGGYSRVWQESRTELFEDLSYDRFFLGLAVRIYSTGENPREPDRLGSPTDEEPDSQ